MWISYIFFGIGIIEVIIYMKRYLNPSNGAY
jgi:hypothetical protein